MYQPEGTRPLALGTLTATPCGTGVTSSATDRWSTSVAWVTALGRIRRAAVIFAVSGVANATVVPRCTAFGPWPMTGRSPLNRYGGLNTSMRCSKVPGFSPVMS